MKYLLYSCVVIAIISTAYSEVVTLHACSDDEVKNCVINEVRITPCKEAVKDFPCKFKKQKTASIEVDFTPEFKTDKTNVQMYWPNGFIDLPLAGMENDGCKTTTCPTTPSVKQTYTYDLKIASYFPLSTYDVKWILKGDDAETQQCCFIYKIKISK